jgi:hypothetical protein
MKKSVKEFAESINMAEACPSNTSHLLSNADTSDLLAPSEASDYQDLPNDCLDRAENAGKLPDVPPVPSKDLIDESANISKRSLNDSNPNPWILVQVNMCVIGHLCDCWFLIKKTLAELSVLKLLSICA